MKRVLLVLLFLHGLLNAQEFRENISVHDPVMAKQGDTFFLFSTGQGVSIWSSKDLISWKREKAVFSEAPKWAVEAIPNFKGHIWAPDISFYNGKYYLYYSVSAFGKNTSAIGLATNNTLDPVSADYKWVDHGKIIQSYPGVTNWNAIDPNIITDNKGRAYMSFGSFWDGLKLVRLSEDRMSIGENPEKLLTIASREPKSSAKTPLSVDNNPADAGENAIEAPFIFKRGKYYYLFASTDYCCKGANSTYKMIVGRSKKVKGPYRDKDGVSLARAGGTLLMKGDKNWYGVGHNSVYNFDGTDYLIFHGYEAADNGRSKLRIEKLVWDEGWPSVLNK